MLTISTIIALVGFILLIGFILKEEVRLQRDIYKMDDDLRKLREKIAKMEQEELE